MALFDNDDEVEATCFEARFLVRFMANSLLMLPPDADGQLLLLADVELAELVESWSSLGGFSLRLALALFI